MTYVWKKHRCGTQDSTGQRVGCEKWERKKKHYQSYIGKFLYNNLHNRGIYTINQKKDKFYMDGLFYCNKLEGYGQMVYANGDCFEGLFKQHQRFGPGILTYADGTQDVGLWYGSTLMRLSTVIASSFTPMLGKTSQGQAFLLKYHRLVPLFDKPKDRAKELLESLGASEELLARSDELYNKHVNHVESAFFNTNLYDDHFFDEKEDCIIEIIENDDLQQESEESRHSLKKQQSQEDTSCDCFAINNDYFTQLCVQLQDIEAKLQKLSKKKEELEEIAVGSNTTRDKSSRMLSGATKTETNILKSETELSTTNYQDSRHAILSNISTNDLQDEYGGEQDKIHFLGFDDEDVSINKKSIDIIHPSDEEQFSSITLPFEINKDTTYIGGEYNKLMMVEDTPDEQVSDMGLAKEATCSQVRINHEESHHLKPCNSKLAKLHQDIAFYKAIKSNLQTKIDREYAIAHKIVENNEENVKKVKITDLIAFNNEDTAVEMLQHCFRHRKSQYNVTFNVTDILAAQRQFFACPGAIETACSKFLLRCLKGNDVEAFILLKHYTLNPDVSDAHGNTGVMLATMADRLNVIEMLTNFGAKLDVENDEGVTPLIMCLLRYLWLIMRISDWEKAFLREPKLRPQDMQGIKEWCPNKYLMRCKAPTNENVAVVEMAREKVGSIHLVENACKSTTDICFSSKTIIPNLTLSAFSEVEEKLAKLDGTAQYIMPLNFFRKPAQNYVLSNDYVRLENESIVHKKKKGKGAKSLKSVTTTTKSIKSAKSLQKKRGTTISISVKSITMSDTKSNRSRKEDDLLEQREKLIAKKIEDVRKTLTYLLNLKANPNVGRAPMKPLFLTLFMRKVDFLQLLLEHGANPNETSDENATCLHYLAATQPPIELQTLEMTKILFKFHADPNIKTNCKHWSEITQELSGTTSPNDETVGKNALHVLCVREDFSRTEIGIFGGLAQIFIRNGCNVNDLYMGHTPLSLAVYRANFALIDSLLDSKLVDPYQELGNDMGNVVSLLFQRSCLGVWSAQVRKDLLGLLLSRLINPLKPIGGRYSSVIHYLELHKEEAVPRTQIKKKEKKKKSSSKGSKKSVKKKKSKSKNVLAELEQYLRAETLQILLKHWKCFAIRYLYLFIMENIYYDPVVMALARFVRSEETLIYLKLLFHCGLISLSDFSFVVVGDLLEYIAAIHEEPFNREAFTIKLQQLSFLDTKLDLKVDYLQLPELDTYHYSYIVCFECLQSVGKVLKKCCSCELALFCSDQCAKQPNDWHYCRGENFYNYQPDEVQDRLNLVIELAEKSRKQRLHMFKLSELENKLKDIKFKPVMLLKKIAQMRSRSEELDVERNKFATKNQLLNYTSAANSLYDYAEGKVMNWEGVAVEMSDEVSVSAISLKKRPREKSHFLSNETVQKKSKLITKLGGHYSKMPMVYTTLRDPIEQVVLKVPQICPSESDKKQKMGGEQKVEEYQNKCINKTYYMEMLSKVFADFNLPLMLLPYACYKDGQIYYSMSDNVYFRKSFQKLNIPD